MAYLPPHRIRSLPRMKKKGETQQAEQRNDLLGKQAMNQQEKESKLWDSIKADMERLGSVGAYGFEAYISELTLKQDTGTKLVFEYPAGFLIDWVEMNYLAHIKNSAARVMDAAREICFVAAGEMRAEQVEEAPVRAKNDKAVSTQGKERNKKPINKKVLANSGLNGDFTFENFIEGANSEFAYAAAKAVATAEKEFYNPLFIYGDSGLGKTHLLHAIGNAIREHRENAQVVYVTSEDFTNSYIEAISRKGEALNNFRRKYRKADVLLIDDVQFLASKGKTQEEFFHTFNALFSSGKQIVLSSDCPASEITTLDKRLQSRFEQGLSVELLPPNYETRMAILRHKVRQWKCNVASPELLEFLARNITRSVRTLEGALVRIGTYSSFSNRKVTVAEAKKLLKDLLNTEKVSTISVDEIQRRVAEEFNIRQADLNGRRRTADIAHPRQIAMYLARRYTQLSLQDIGAAFGGRDHGTVIHASKTIETKMRQDPDLRAVINRMAADVI